MKDVIEPKQPLRRLLALTLAIAVTFTLGIPVSASADPREAILNQADLDPTDPRSGALDAYLEAVMADLIDEDMDTYDKVRACYDYVVANTSYGNHMRYLSTPVGGAVTCGDIYSAYGEVEGFGAVALTAKTGMCNAYASAFILMARKIGLEASLVTGSTKAAGGGYAYHEWAEVTIDGSTYLFDPQLEQDLSKAGMAYGSVFCKTYDQVPGRFIKY